MDLYPLSAGNIVIVWIRQEHRNKLRGALQLIFAVRAVQNMIRNPRFKNGIGIIGRKARQSKIVRDDIVGGSQNLKFLIVSLEHL